jgi:hypothetical protein
LRLNCNNFRAYLKAIEVVGNEVIFDLKPNDIVVKGIGSSNELIIDIKYVAETGCDTDVALSIELLQKLLPKGVDEVDFTWNKDECVISATGFNAKIRSIGVPCVRVPKKDFPIAPEYYLCGAQQLYEKLDSLKKAFDGQTFILSIDPKKQGVIELSDLDASIGSLQTSVVTVTPFTKVENQTYAYDIIMPVLNGIRIGSSVNQIGFVDLPANEGIKAILIEGGMVGENLEMVYKYMVAPRLRG